ncbi:MAG: TIGR01777 family protein [Flavobacteriales bacterium]|nr:TIGR01777 family oxidoreductase [Bacteroidota bacterium]MCB9241109.1 TIGR01777 family protein [Flavobacteriales bacterium]
MAQSNANQLHTPKTILITGGRGFIGRALTHQLKSRGHRVRHLSRSRRPDTFYWNIEKSEIDPEALRDVQVIIHLAGASVAEGRWTAGRKKLLRSSRIDSAKLLYRALVESGANLERFISASGTGYYGVSNEKAFVESDPPASGFLADLCVDWEQSVQPFTDFGAQVTVNRIGIVMHPDGGFVAKLKPLVNAGLGSILGTGKQILPWVHLDDLVDVFVQEVEGVLHQPVYNIVAPATTTHAEVMHALAHAVNRKIWLPKVPGFIIRLALGKLATELLESQDTQPAQLISEGFVFRHPTIDNTFLF